MHRFAILIAIAIPLGLSVPAVPASASERDGGADARARTEVIQAPVNAAAALAAAQTAGLGTVRSIEWEHGTWKVKAIGTDGRRAKMYVDAQTGVVTPRNR
jgi:hypothetical protein